MGPLGMGTGPPGPVSFFCNGPGSMSPASLLTCPVPYYLTLDAALFQASRELCSVPLLRLV